MDNIAYDVQTLPILEIVILVAKVADGREGV